jgi:hypothetical protein
MERKDRTTILRTHGIRSEHANAGGSAEVVAVGKEGRSAAEGQEEARTEAEG